MERNRLKDDEENLNDEQKKVGYLSSMKETLNSQRKMNLGNDLEDLASHWILKIALNKDFKGDYVMFESQLYSARIF